MKRSDRRKYGKAAVSKKKHRTHLQPKLPTYDEWKSIVNDFEDMKSYQHKNNIDTYHHQDTTITSQNRLNNNMRVKPILSHRERLSKQFFHPRSPPKLQPLKSPKSPESKLMSPARLKRLKKEKENNIISHFVKLFQRKSGLKLFYLYDKDKKGYLNEKQVCSILNDIGYDRLNSEYKQKICNKLQSLCSENEKNLYRNRMNPENKNMNKNKIVTFSNLRQIDIEDTNYLGDRLSRLNQEQRLYRQYLNPLNPKTNDNQIFFCENDREAAQKIINKLQTRYNNLEKPLTKLKCWDLNRNGKIEKSEMKKILNKMNIYLNENQLNEFFNIFHSNERKYQQIAEKKNKNHIIDPNTISYPVFMQTITGRNNFNEDISRNNHLLKSPKRKEINIKPIDIDNDTMNILGRLRNRAETKFGSNNLATNVFRYLDVNFNSNISHNEIKDRLKYIDSEITPKQASKMVKLFDPNNNGSVKFNRFAQCFNFPIHKETKYLYNDNPHKRLNKSIFDIDPRSTYFASNKQRFNKNKFIPKSLSIQSPTKELKVNKSNASYNILHHQ